MKNELDDNAKHNLIGTNLLLTLIFLMPFSILAQHANLSLKNKSVNVPANNYTISHIFDARADTTMIGRFYDYSSMPVSLKTTYFESSLKVELMYLFDNDKTYSGDKSLIMTVNKLQIYDFEVKSKLYRVLELNVDFYVFEDGSYYHEFNAGEYILTSKKKEVLRIDRMITTAFERCFKEFLFRMNNELGYHKEVSLLDVQSNSAEQPTSFLPISFKGEDRIYYTFNMFKDSISDIETGFFLYGINSKYPKDIKKFRYDPPKSSLTDVSEIWGVAYNDELHIQIDGLFVKTLSTDSGLTIQDMINFKNPNQTLQGFSIGSSLGIAIGSLVGGPPVSVLAGAAAGGIGALIGSASKRIELTSSVATIDMLTGLPVAKSNSTELPKPLVSMEIVFYTWNFRGNNPDLFINDQIICSLEKNSYFDYAVSDTIKNLVACIKSSTYEECEQIVRLVDSRKVYYEVISQESGKVYFKKQTDHNTIRWVENRIRNEKLTLIE